MTTAALLASGARQMLRDFPRFFEIQEGPLNVLTIRLPHPCVMASSLQVYVVDETADPPTSVLTDKWECDERNGLLKLTDNTLLGKTIVVAGYHSTWFTDGDLAFAVGQVSAELLYNTDDELSDFTEAEAEVAMVGVVVRALWSLSLEFSMDIDVSTPEGMFIPAHQRYSQVLQMMQYWEQEYESKLGSLNMGLGRLEQFRLRRVSQTTGRYVPVYVDREFDDPRWPKRLYPEVPSGTTDSTETPLWVSVDRVTETTQGHYPAATFPAVLGTGGRSSPRE